MQTLFVHNEPGQKEHNKTLAASGRAKVSTAFAIAEGLLMRKYIGKQLAGGEVLRITGNDLDIFAVVGIREIDKVVNNVKQPVFAEHSLNHGIQRINTIGRAVIHLDTPPGVKMLIVGKDTAGFGVHAIRKHRKAVVFEKLRNIPHIAGGDLNISIVDGRIFLDGRLELHHHHRQTVDVNNGIGAAGGFGALDSHLVDNLDNIFVVFTVKVDQLQMKVLGVAVFADKGFALDYTLEHSAIGTVCRLSMGITQRADNGIHFGCRDSL